MAIGTLARHDDGEAAFRHEALFYGGDAEFVAATASFVRAAVEDDSPILVAVAQRKIDLLRQALGDAADEVVFADKADVGANPARIIPAWQAFVDQHGAGGRPVRGIGEPIEPDRGPAELVECQRHETLLNLAFADVPSFWLVCPYDVDAMDDDVLAEARRSHPSLLVDGAHRPSRTYSGDADAVGPFDRPLTEPRTHSRELRFGGRPLGAVRAFVAEQARVAGLGVVQVSDLMLAVSEAAGNSIRHGGGAGTVRTWAEGDRFVCEVRDDGHLDAPLAGRRRPGPHSEGGRGLWLINQLCDLVQLRTLATGTVLRLHMHRR